MIDYSLLGGAEAIPDWLYKRLDPRHASVAMPKEKGLVGEQWAPRHVEHDANDWLWSLNEEPHRSRRRAIIKAHPEVTKLMGHEPLTRYVVVFVTCVQFMSAYFFRNTPLSSPWLWLWTYCVGAVAAQNTFLAIHEITHNLAFRGIKANRIFAIFANLPVGVPFSMTFKRYHMEHHKYLGEDGIDTDLPTKFELLFLNNVLGKVFFATFQLFFYAVRPGLVRYHAPTRWIITNVVVQILADVLMVYAFGWRFLRYLVLCDFFAGSLHPIAGHFIAEHYLFEGLDQETWSYYGPLNIFTYNVGYHNEHHDFPSIPWTRLPKVRELAPEFYNALPHHTSWAGVIYRFICDPRVGLSSRVKRKQAADDDQNGDDELRLKKDD